MVVLIVAGGYGDFFVVFKEREQIAVVCNECFGHGHQTLVEASVYAVQKLRKLSLKAIWQEFEYLRRLVEFILRAVFSLALFMGVIFFLFLFLFLFRLLLHAMGSPTNFCGLFLSVAVFPKFKHGQVAGAIFFKIAHEISA